MNDEGLDRILQEHYEEQKLPQKRIAELRDLDLQRPRDGSPEGARPRRSWVPWAAAAMLVGGFAAWMQGGRPLPLGALRLVDSALMPGTFPASPL